MASWDWLIICGRGAEAHGECEGVDLVLVRYRVRRKRIRSKRDKPEQNQAKREAWQSREKSKVVAVGGKGGRGTWGCMGEVRGLFGAEGYRLRGKDYAQTVRNQSKTGQYRTQDLKSTSKAESTSIFLQQSANEA
nr:hypothetical protein [Tanacetum cinerariifolium]